MNGLEAGLEIRSLSGRRYAIPCRAMHAAVFGFELVERCGAQPMSPAHHSRWHSSFLPFDRYAIPGLCETTLSHVFAPSKVEQTLH